MKKRLKKRKKIQKNSGDCGNHSDNSVTYSHDDQRLAQPPDKEEFNLSDPVASNDRELIDAYTINDENPKGTPLESN